MAACEAISTNPLAGALIFLIVPLAHLFCGTSQGPVKSKSEANLTFVAHMMKHVRYE